MRRHPARRGRRRLRVTRLLVAVMVILLLPVPWMHAVSADPPGAHWRLDGRLRVDGAVVDPPGRWSWLTVGRPPLVAELTWSWLVSDGAPARDLRDAPLVSQPSVNEPVAAAIGLRAAGADLDLQVVVEARGAQRAGLPDPARIVELNRTALVTRDDWDRASRRAVATTTFRTIEGGDHAIAGSVLPYDVVLVSELAPAGFEAGIGSSFDWLPPVRWLRSLALGRSHGLMVALITYAQAADRDLAAERHIAGTGTIRGDGSVGPIGGLLAKAAAARAAGADVLLFPAEQAEALEGFDPGTMQLGPVDSLQAAIDLLDP